MTHARPDPTHVRRCSATCCCSPGPYGSAQQIGRQEPRQETSEPRLRPVDRRDPDLGRPATPPAELPGAEHLLLTSALPAATRSCRRHSSVQGRVLEPAALAPEVDLPWTTERLS